MPELRVAVLGLGSIGRRHLRNLQTLGAGALIGFDPTAGAADVAAREHGIRTTTSLDDVWAFTPAAVFITAPSHRHVPLALEAARRGCDLFVEKPLSDRLDDIDQLRRLAEQQQLVTMVGCNMRFHPGPAAVARLVRERAIGEVLAARIHTGSYLPAWRPGTRYLDSYSAKREQGGGAVLDCIHELDLALWYFGPADLVAAAVRPARALGLEIDGLAEILLQHESGTLSSVHLNYVQRDYLRFCQVIGEAGTLHWHFDSPRVEIRSGSGDPRHVTWPADWTLDRMFVDEVAAFLRCVRERETAPNGIAEAERTLRLALLARERGTIASQRVGNVQEPAR
jgi:predicted dehydrogenase